MPRWSHDNYSASPCWPTCKKTCEVACKTMQNYQFTRWHVMTCGLFFALRWGGDWRPNSAPMAECWVMGPGQCILLFMVQTSCCWDMLWTYETRSCHTAFKMRQSNFISSQPFPRRDMQSDQPHQEHHSRYEDANQAIARDCGSSQLTWVWVHMKQSGHGPWGMKWKEVSLQLQV